MKLPGRSWSGSTAQRPDLLVCFASPDHVGAFEDISGGLRKLLEPEAMIGCTAGAIAGGSREVEDGPALSIFAARFGAGRADPFHLEAAQTDDGFVIEGWPDEVPARGTLLLLADPYSFPVPDFLRLVNAQVPELTVVGGLASSAAGPGGNRLVCDARIGSTGAVAVLCSSDVPVRPVVSQGCRPIGQPFTVTKSERNLVFELAGQPAMQRLQDLVLAADEHERELMRQGLHIGVVVDEHKLDFTRGDFLVRNVLGADQSNGALVGRRSRAGWPDRAVPHPRRRRRARRPACAARPGRGRGRAAVHVQRTRHPLLRERRPRRHAGHRPTRFRAACRRALRGRDRTGRRSQLPARIHGQRRNLRVSQLPKLRVSQLPELRVS